VVRDESPLGKVRAVARVAANASALKEGSLAVCEVAARLARELGLEQLEQEITEVYERWDGKGFPRGVPAARVGLAARIVAVAEAAEIFRRLDGVPAAAAI